MATVLKDSFAKESGHWYRPDGEPAYEIVGSNGKLRNTTIRDARKHGLFPSVTTILRMASAPGLERWKISNAIMSALTLPRQEGESDESYIDRIVKDSEEQARKARDRGTAIHGAIERMDYTGLYGAQVVAAMQSVANWLGIEEGEEHGWDSERSFCSPIGYGGKLDLSGDGFVCDFKTTDKPLADIKTWPDHRRQLAAYRVGIGMPNAKCAICYVSTKLPEAKVIEIPEDELTQGWHEFMALLTFWRAANKW